MKKQMAIALRSKAEDIARQFSFKDRANNFDNETFHVDKITVLSETTAAITFLKTPTNKKAVAWLYWINGKKPGWQYFFVTYNHLVGLNRVSSLLHHIEQHNFEQSTSQQEQLTPEMQAAANLGFR